MRKAFLFSVASALALSLVLALTDLGEAAGKGKPGGGGSNINPAIVYTARQGSGIKIMVANADGTNRIVVVDNGSINTRPSWSPDGKHIIFTSDVNGAGIYRVTINRSTGLAQGSPVKIIPLGISGGFSKAAWSPNRFSNGKYMLAYGDIDSTGLYASIYLQTIEDDGTPTPGIQPVELRNLPRDAKFVSDYFPSWAPNGAELVVTAATATGGEPDPNYDVQIITLGATCNGAVVCDAARESLIHGFGNASPLASSVSFVFNPEWGEHRDLGDGILVQGPDDGLGNPDIWLIPVSDPEAATNLTATLDRLESNDAAWSPDGVQMIYSVRANDCDPLCHDVAVIARRDVVCTLPCAETVLIKEKYPVGGAKWWKPQ
jgi:Periplasmic component of the Tol biopolymer transport system